MAGVVAGAKRVVAFDPELMRPGCVLVQAAMGGDPQVVSRLFDSSKWLTHPTPGMKLIAGTDEQWVALAELDV